MKRIVPALVALLLFAGCSSTEQSAAPDRATSKSVGTSATASATTVPSGTTSTTQTPQPEHLPVARELLGQTYGELWTLTEGQLTISQARGHTDVALSLKSSKLPCVEILNADGAFADWTAAIGMIGDPCPEDALKSEHIITDLHITSGGYVTETLMVGKSVADWKVLLPSLPDMTILYDFAGGMNRTYYGSIQTTIDGANALLWVDLSTEAAKAALAEQNIVLGESAEVWEDPWLDQKVSLPDLPIAGADLWLDDKG